MNEGKEKGIKKTELSSSYRRRTNTS